MSCDDSVAFGEECTRMKNNKVDHCAVNTDGVCVECKEGFFSEPNTCPSCGGARRCVGSDNHLLCSDNAVLIDGT